MNAADFVKRRIEAFGRGDVDTLVGDYTPSSVIMTPMGNMTGAEQVRGMISGFVQEFGMKGTTFEVLRQNTTDRVGHFAWRAETPKNSYRFGAETYFLDANGKVAVHVFDGDIVPKG
jgi:hypothetical protein